MDFYLALDGSKAGPFSIFKVGDLLESGSITIETLAWHRGLDHWKPIREIGALNLLREHLEREEKVESPPLSSQPPSPERVSRPFDRDPFPPPLTVPEVGPMVASAAAPEPVHPFLRFWARMFDYTLVSVIVFYFSGIKLPQPQLDEAWASSLSRYMEAMRQPEVIAYTKILVFSLLTWHVVESILLHLVGTTPGKAIFGIRVRSANGSRISLRSSLGRSFYVYLLGVGFYQFPFFLIGAAFGYFRLVTTGLCLWDTHLGTRVTHSPIGPVRILLAIFAFLVLFGLQSAAMS